MFKASVRPSQQGAFEDYHACMQKRGKTAHLYFTRCNEGINTYFINSQGDTVYHRPQTITGARRLARKSPRVDYDFTRLLTAKDIPATLQARS